jgi:predicted dehydrogenase
MTERVRIGIAGYGLMARAHTYGYRTAAMVADLPEFEIVALAGRDQAAASSAARQLGIEHVVSYDELVSRPDIDVVDICTATGTHAQLAAAAAAHGKHVICEKPLGSTLAEAESALAAVEAAGVRHAIGFTYRHLPALALLHTLVARGDLGDVRTVRLSWRTDEFANPDTPFDYRFDRQLGGSIFGDLGSHLIDAALWSVGEVSAVAAQHATFITERDAGGSPREVEVDDAGAALLRFTSGATGTLDLARVAIGRPCDYIVEINGSGGTALFDYSQLNELWVARTGEDPENYGMRRVRVEHPVHPYSSSGWPLGQGIGYGSAFTNQVISLFSGWPEREWEPGFDQGVAVQRVIDAMERACDSGSWETPR